MSSLFEEKQRLDGASNNEEFGYTIAISDNGLILAIGAPFTSHFGGRYSNSGSVYIFARKSRLDDFVEIDRFDGGCHGENLGDGGVAINVTEKGLIIRAKGYSCGNGKYVRSYELQCECHDEDHVCSGFTDFPNVICETAAPTTSPVPSSVPTLSLVPSMLGKRKMR
eukprot:CAMPEP_0194415224 /NCGR_PEP_ID=MMETSP0176-20130528/13974_1 /TAXON_ID=216777 /ORGANISM="Proboscia alata, Strain PI-D3" /LENGTH=166 /DNA_ID=CAMNT_0039219727 /DNA_START=1 /DNA_END=501 /DNA_ORIENTATION=-